MNSVNLGYPKGLLKSPVDDRDYIYTSVVEPMKAAPPEECYQWMDYKTPVKYQSTLGACTAFTGVCLAEILNNKQYGTTLDLSEQFLYSETKKIDGVDEEGTYLRAILKTMKNVGVCEESYQPYEAKYPPSYPPLKDAYKNAEKYKIASYASVGIRREALKQAIYQTGPVLVGIEVYPNFEMMGDSGIAQMPAGDNTGYHALPLVGYNADGLIAKNSWSIYWGNDGYCTIPWSVWSAINVGEAWSVIDDTKNTSSCIIVKLFNKLFSRK